MAYHEERFVSFLKKEIAAFLQKKFEIGEGVILSVSRVAWGGGAGQAKAYVLVYPERYAKDTLRRLKRFEESTRKYLASRARRAFIPKIIFLSDTGQEDEIRLEKLLEKIENE